MSCFNRISNEDIYGKEPVKMMLSPLEPIILKNPFVMSVTEIAEWACVGKNTVPQIIARFGLNEVTGHGKNRRYRTKEVLRRVTGMNPATSEDVTLLLKPLQQAAWVSTVLGISVSALSENARSGRTTIPTAIQLSETTKTQQAPRGRRWIPAQIEIYLEDLADPFVKMQKRKLAASRRVNRNVFGEICAGNTARSR